MRVKEQISRSSDNQYLSEGPQNTISDFLMDIDNVELTLPISYTKEILEEELHD